MRFGITTITFASPFNRSMDVFARMIQADLTPKPTSFGNYQIVRKIASGGMAEVFEAYRIGSENFQTQVALKCIRPELTANERFLKMFINEAHLGSQLHHPNIVQIQDFNRVEDIYYIAMEYVEGTDLAHFMQYAVSTGEPLPHPVILDLALQALTGLSYAHDARSPDGQPMNIVHRDLKPSNFLINRQGALKIADFGIAKASTNTYQTQTQDHIKGTLKYMSPEQVDGAMLTPSSDLFSFAVILYELATQRELFDAPGIAATLIKIATANIGEDLNYMDTVWAEMGSVLRKALDRDPEQRFESAGESVKVLRTMDSPFTIDGALERYIKANPGIFKAPESATPETLNVPRAPIFGIPSPGPAPRASTFDIPEEKANKAPRSDMTGEHAFALQDTQGEPPKQQEEITAASMGSPIDHRTPLGEGPDPTSQLQRDALLGSVITDQGIGVSPTKEETTASGSGIPPEAARQDEPDFSPDAFEGLYRDGAEQGASNDDPPPAMTITGESLIYPVPQGGILGNTAEGKDFTDTPSTSQTAEEAEDRKSRSGIGVFAGIAITLLMVIVAVLIYDRLMTPTVPTLLVLDSSPPGAKVFVNGISVGKQTPSRINLPDDQSSVGLRLELDGYKDFSQELNYRPGTVSERKFNLIALPKPKANLSITSVPVGAKIILNGSDTGKATPHTFEAMETDSYTVTLELQGFKPMSFDEMALEDGDVIEKHADLEIIPPKVKNKPKAKPRNTRRNKPPKRGNTVTETAPVEASAPVATGSGKVTINSLPMDATVIVDGKTMGRVPLSRVTLSAGEHNLTLKLGEIVKYHKFTVKDGDELKLVWDFRNGRWMGR